MSLVTVFLKLIICSLRKLVKLWQFQLCKAAEERRMGWNNAVLKNYQSALATSKSNRHKLEDTFSISMMIFIYCLIVDCNVL